MSKQKMQSRHRMRVRHADHVPTAPGTPLASVVAIAVALAVLGVAVWAVYGRAVDGPFVFDDEGSVVTNPTIRTLWPLVGNAEHPGALNPPHQMPVAGRPLVNLSF